MSLASAWERAFTEGQQCVVDAETLLCSPWLVSLPLSSPASEEAPSEYAELVIVGLYYTGEPGSQATSALICTPAPVGTEVVDGLQTSVMSYAVDGAECGEVEVIVALIEPAFLYGKITDSCPSECGVSTFFPEHPGALPRGGDVFSLLELPSVFTAGFLLYLDAGDSCLRLSVDGEQHNEIMYHSAGEDVAAPEELVASVFGAGASKRRPKTRGAKAPNFMGLKAPAAKLLDVLSAGGAPAKSRARRPSMASATGIGTAAASGGPKESASMQAELLGAIASIGERLSKLEHQQTQASSRPSILGPSGMGKSCPSQVPAAAPMAPSVQTVGPGCTSKFGSVVHHHHGLHPPGHAPAPLLSGVMSRPPSILGPPPGKSAGDAAYSQSMEQVRLLLKQHAGVVPPPSTEGVSHAKARQSDVLREMVAQGSADGGVAFQLALLDALERIGKKEKASEDSDLVEDIFAGSDGDIDFSAASGAKGAAALSKLATSIEKFPDKWSNQFDKACAAACGAYETGLPWSVSLYADRCVRFKGLETHERAFAMLGHLHMLSRTGQHALLGARIGQFLKSIETSVAAGGNWNVAWLLTGLPEVRSASNT
eukprot:6478686-Amphidinium_carterae.1